MVQARFIFPNFFTSINFLLGVYAILLGVGAFQPEAFPPYILAANFILYCVLLDKLDGFAAKVMNARSEFGAQFDSLADLIAFGLAPAFVTFFTYLALVPEWAARNKPMLLGTLSLYVLTSAMRLARYNALDADEHPDYFVGMPSTMAGAFNALAIILAVKYDLLVEGSPWLPVFPLALAVTAVLMVSPLFLPKVKSRKNKLLNILQIIAIITAYAFGFAMKFPEYLMGLVAVYFICGFGHGILKKGQILEVETLHQQRDS